MSLFRRFGILSLLVAGMLLFFTPSVGYAQQPQRATSTATTTQPAPANNVSSQGATQNVEQFVALTSIPGLNQIGQLGNADGLANFLNQLYRLCIGAAAIIAVIQIMRAGFEFMRGSQSWQSNQKAKDLIKNAVFGLLLVLSPVIVFSVINPDILDLNLSFESLRPTPPPVTGTATSTPAQTNPSTSGATLPAATPQVSGTGVITLALYYTRTNSTTGYSCYQPQVMRFTDQSTCAAQRTSIENGTILGGTPPSQLVIPKSCVVTPADYQLVLPTDKPTCS